MKLRRLETRIRRSPRGHVAQPDNGNNPAERPSQAKGQRGKPSKCIFPNLLQPSDHPSKSHDQGKTLSPKIAPSFEDGGLLSSPGSSQGDSHAVKDSMLDHGDDDDHGSSVDIDDLSSIESDDLDRLLGYRDECFSSTLIPDPASVAELVSLQGCNTSTDEPEQTMGFFDGAHAQSNRNPMLVPSLEETSCQTVISHALSQARFACPGLRGGTVDPKDGTIVMLEGPGQKDHDSPVVEVPGDTLHDRSGQEPAALMVCLPDIVEHSSSPAGNRRQSLGTQEGPMFATDNTAAVGSAVEYSNAEKIDRLLTTVWEGTSPDLESASPYGGLPGQHGIREVCRIKPTAFEEQYTTYQRSRSGKEVECQTVPRYEVQTLTS